MGLTNLIQDFKQGRKQRQEFNSLRDMAVNDARFPSMMNFSDPVNISQDIRNAYMQIFEDMAELNTIDHEVNTSRFNGSLYFSVGKKGNIPFSAKSKLSGSNLILNFSPNEVNFDIYRSKFNEDLENFETEAARISTFYDSFEDETKTSLVAYNNNFEREGQEPSNYAIPKALTKVQGSKYIPSIDEKEFDKLPENYKLHGTIPVFSNPRDRPIAGGG